ncbi:MAG TPA: glycosyltransferase family 4 protein [Gaiellaceae bacterium]|nr:glycosyltransferase family 4 protein [Gaiellaceae bacterium]
MLVKSGLAHSAHVRKTAASLDRAGYEVFVLGAVRNEGSPSGWKQEDGFRSRVVAAPELAPSRRAERAAARHKRLERRRDLAAARLAESGGGLRRRALRWRHDRLRRAAERARETAKRDRAEAKARRQLEDPLNLRRYEAAWWPLVRELRPDVVHAFDVSGMGVARRAKRLGARFLYEAHEPKRHVADTEREEAERRQAVLYAAEADALIAVTEPLAEVLVEQLGLPQPPPLVHCTPVLDPGEPPPWGLREAAGVGEDTPLLVFAGLLARRRRTEVVLEAMTLLPDVHFALVVREDDPLTVELLGRGRELGVAERVHVVPKVPPRAVSPFIAAADVGVIPYNRSAGKDLVLGNKLFEYLHAGLPMVVSDCTAQAEFVRRYGLGESAPTDDPEAWAEAIRRVLEMPRYSDRTEEWEALKREWSWERQEQALLGVYRELTGVSRS